jgi:predicted O-methyltransferase YrrM
MEKPQSRKSMAKRNQSSGHGYILATGERGIDRLKLLATIFDPMSHKLLRNAGLREGMRVAEIGCGVGLIALWIAAQIGVSGSLVAVDSNEEQLRIAEQNAAAAGLKNISFHRAAACETGLSRGYFDLVYSRFLMCHLTEPEKALLEMRALLNSGGILVCEDFEMSAVCTKPATHSYERLVSISRSPDRELGVDSDIGPKLPDLFAINGCGNPEVATYESTSRRGDAKGFWKITLREAAPAILEHGIANAQELDWLCDDLDRIADDDSILVVLARVYQVWSRKC